MWDPTAGSPTPARHGAALFGFSFFLFYFIFSVLYAVLAKIFFGEKNLILNKKFRESSND